tara:strand:- start:21459 stop:22361 length:903 start_codon:yes stop_codon:yes gene_type:complete
MFYTPILFLIFNRPEVTQKVFEEIKKQKPKYLFVAADGPRPNFEEDKEKCKKCRDIVLKGIDWDCEVKTLFRDENLGCGRGVSSAINWFFENVEQGIILEDDCLPHPSFFMYCETLLNKYKDHENIYVISGSNFQNGIQRGDASYYFSNYGFVWGWASWRRAWVNYDFNLGKLYEFQKNNLISKIDDRKKFNDYWNANFEKVKGKQIDTWDYQWLFALWNNNGIAAISNENLISNIGFGNDATHTIKHSPLANIPTKDINSLRHPRKIKINKEADKYASKFVFEIPFEENYLIRKLKSLF